MIDKEVKSMMLAAGAAGAAEMLTSGTELAAEAVFKVAEIPYTYT